MSRLWLAGLVVTLLAVCVAGKWRTITRLGQPPPSPGLVADIGSISKIEVVTLMVGSTVGGPTPPKGTPEAGVIGVLDRKSHPAEFASAKSELSRMLVETYSRGGNSLVPHVWLRLYPSGKPYTYYCKLHTKDRYFEIYHRDSHPKIPEFDPGGEVGALLYPTDRFIDSLAASVPSKIRARLFR